MTSSNPRRPEGAEGLRVDVLGPFEVWFDGDLVDLGGPRQRAVLAALALQANKTVPAERLMDAVWGEDHPATAKSTLQAYVSRLRKSLAAVAPDLIDRDGVGYVLRLPAGALDIERFWSLVEDGRRAVLTDVPSVAASRFAEALGEWRGDPLGDLSDYAFAEIERSRLGHEHRAIRGEWIDAELAAGAHQKMVGTLEVLVAQDPLHEPYWERLMIALYRCGQQGDALAAYQNARTALIESLGIEPGPALAAIETAILQHDPALDITPQHHEDAPENAPLGSGGVIRDGLLARDRELDDIDRRILDLGMGGGLIVISGDAGVGKTALATAAAEHAAALGAMVIHGRGWEGGGAPAFWPWIEALRSLVAQHGVAKVAELAGPGLSLLAVLLPELDPDAAVDETRNPSQAQFAVYEAVSSVLLGAASEHALVFVLDDVQWADASSIELLRFLAPRLASSQLLVLAGRRDPAVVSDSVLAALISLDTALGVEAVRLDPLDDQTMAELVRRVAPRASTEESVGQIVRRSEGIPLFALELARQTHPGGDAIPVSLSESILRRVDSLSPDARTFLRSAAVAGQEFSLPIIGHSVDQHGAQLLASVEVAIDAGIVAPLSGRPGWYRFHHGLVRDALFATLGPAERAAMHEQLASALGDLARPGTHAYVAERAHHALEAAIVNPDPTVIDLAEQAALQALRTAGYDEAVGWLARAERIAAAGGDRQRWCEVVLRRGDVENRAGWADRAKETHLEAADLARELKSGRLLALAAVGYAFTRIDIQLVDEVHIALCTEADRMLDPADSDARAQLLASWGTAYYWEDAARSHDLIEQAIAMARRIDNSSVLGSALVASAWLAFGDGARRLELGREMLELARHDRDAELELWAHHWMYVGLFDIEGPTQRCRAAQATYRERAQSAHQPHHQWFSTMFEANLAMSEGRMADGEPLIEAAFEVGQRAEPITAMQYYGSQMFNLRWLQGRIDELIPLAEMTVAQYQDIHTWRALLAYLYACAAEPAKARQRLRELRAVGWTNIGSGGTLIMAQALAAEAAVLSGDEDVGSELVDHFEAWGDRYVHMAFVTTMGSAPFFHGRLLAQSGDLDEGIDRLRQALELDELRGLAPLVARDQLVLAGLLEKRSAPGDASEANEVRLRADRTVDELGMGGLGYL